MCILIAVSPMTQGLWTLVGAMLQAFIFGGNDVLPDLVLRHWCLLVVQQLLNEIGFMVDQLQAQMAAKLLTYSSRQHFQSFDFF